MDEAALRALIEGIRNGAVPADEAVARLRRLPFADIGDALVDHHRTLRQGLPEAIYGPGKTPEQCARIVGELLDHGTGPVLLTRASTDQAKAVLNEHGPAEQQGGCMLWRRPEPRPERRVLVVTAGTADTPVADEAAITLTAYGLAADRLHDVGVAGLHRLLAHLDRVTAADAVIVVAGMEGALASVIGGLTARPVVAVPTSVGYGSGLDGVTALLAMQASCASGITVVGIDNGFGAASAIARMLPASTRTVWFNCCAGVAGDMLLASLVDAGADRLAVMDAWGALGVDGFAATWERVQRCGVASLWTNLAINHHDHHDRHRRQDEHDHAHRPAAEVIAMIERADLPARVGDDAAAVYRVLAEIEGAIHGIDPAAVELHEVGALDSVLDVVGVCTALHDLGVQRVTYSPIAVGHGTVDTAHGRLPNPVPAVSRLLERADAAVTGVDTTMELSTPTGVALLTVLGDRCGPMPSMTVTATGFGAGTADPPGRPNVVQAIMGDGTPTTSVGTDGRPCHLLEANVDDITGEVLAHTIAALIDAGAHDAWATPIVMKKGRPAHTVHALCDDATFATARQVLIAETGTLGVRASTVHRWPQHRSEHNVDVGGQPIRVKIGETRVKAEHDDALAAARALGRPLREVLAEAEHLGRRFV